MEDSHDILLKHAKKVFAEKGYDGATVKDLAEAAGVNISAVSYHFGGKEGLYRACIENFGKLQFATLTRVLKTADSAAEFRLRLRLFVEEFMRIHLEESDVCRILHRDFDFSNSIAMDIFQTTFIPIYQALVQFFEKALSSGFLRTGLDSETTAALIFAQIVHTVKSDPIRLKISGRSLRDPQIFELVVSELIKNNLDGILHRIEQTQNAQDRT